jgi:hypothetical protein
MDKNKLTIQDININTWFSDRELEIVPSHFTKASTPATKESISWVLEKLTGRFALTTDTTLSASFHFNIRDKFIWFEDPKEAMMYELKWS